MNGVPEDKKSVGRWLGVAEVAMDVMAYFVLAASGKVLIRKSVWGLSKDDPTVTLKLVELDEKIRQKIGDAIKEVDIDPDLIGDLPEPLDDVFEEDDVDDPMEPKASKADADDFTPEAYDQYLTPSLNLPQGGEQVKATVKGRKRDADERPIGKQHPNPLLDTRLYEVEFPDGSTEAITANLIAETMWSQVDNEGRSYLVLKRLWIT